MVSKKDTYYWLNSTDLESGAIVNPGTWYRVKMNSPLDAWCMIEREYEYIRKIEYPNLPSRQRSFFYSLTNRWYSRCMELIILLVVVGAILYVINKKVQASSSEATGTRHQKEIEKSKPDYRYRKKPYIMTRAESELFRRLEKIAGEKYYVFPQAHLSSLLDHAVKGQDWRAALSKIQRKSVDFALVDKQTLVTTYAIELDDRTHDSVHGRIDRDIFVNGTFESAGLPLVRIRDVGAMTDNEIIEAIKAAAAAV